MIVESAKAAAEAAENWTPTVSSFSLILARRLLLLTATSQVSLMILLFRTFFFPTGALDTANEWHSRCTAEWGCWSAALHTSGILSCI